MKILTVLAALFLSSSLVAQDGGTYLATDDIVVVEMESTAPSHPNWSVVTDNSNYTFRSFYRWDGPDYWSSPGNAILTYKFRVTEAGNYRLSIRNRHDHPDSTLENDVWARMDGGSWTKVYSPAPVGQWTWTSRFDPGHANANYNLSAGEHVLQFSARSNAFMMDRFHIYQNGHPDGTNPNRPESPAILGERYCSPAENNSSGGPAEVVAAGNIFPENNTLRILATGMPRDQIAYVIASRTQAFIASPAGSIGNLCLGGNMLRLNGQAKDTRQTGEIAVTVHMPSLGILSGETWNFQVWFREPGTSNFTDATSVLFQ